MVSIAYLMSIMLALVAISRAEEVANQNAEEVDSKWFGGFGYGWGAGSFYSGLGLGLNPWLGGWTSGLYGGCFGYGLLGGLYNNVLFTKASESQSISRRAITLDADLLYRRSEQPVSCVNDKGATSSFLRSDCVKAANQLAEKKVSSASHGSCSLSLVSPKERVAPKQISAAALEKAVDGILKACPTRSNAKQSRRAAKSTESHDKQVAMLLSKAH